MKFIKTKLDELCLWSNKYKEKLDELMTLMLAKDKVTCRQHRVQYIEVCHKINRLFGATECKRDLEEVLICEVALKKISPPFKIILETGKQNDFEDGNFCTLYEAYKKVDEVFNGDIGFAKQ